MHEPIYTVGHSIHPIEGFLALLREHRIERLADIRLIPKSQRYPHFGLEQLSAALQRTGVAYRHFPDLGGRRRPRRDSINTAWRVEAFRGYADYMSTPAFRAGVESLLAYATGARTAVMCAEAVWWQCHRRLLADHLLVRGIPVLHILSTVPPKPHELSDFAREVDGELVYPGLLESPAG
jgi:uncharacterized protein (DUF488 family)